MTETTQMQPTEAEKKIRRWLLRALDAKDYARVQVLYAWQTGNAEARPYVQLEVLTDASLTDPEECVPADEVNTDGTYPVDITEHRIVSVQVSCYGSLAYHMARAVDRSIRRATVTDANRDDGLEVQQALSPILNIPDPKSTHVEPRRVQDFEVAYVELTREKDGTGVLESVNIIGPVDDPEGSFDADITVTWPTP